MAKDSIPTALAIGTSTPTKGNLIVSCWKKAIILGDFNVDLSKNSYEHEALISNMVQSKGYIQLINNYTTHYRTQMDHVYTNAFEATVKVATS